MGAASALALNDRGHHVTIFEQHQLGHPYGSSHGNSRIVRRDYPDPFYSAIMVEAYPLWQILHDRLGGDVLYETGLVYFGHRDSANLKSMHEGLTQLGVQHRMLSASECTEVFPALRLAQGEIALHNEAAGWVNAHRAVSGMVELSQQHGAHWENQRVENPASLIADFDAVCVLAGGWAKKLVDAPVNVTSQTFAYLEVGDAAKDHGPVWIEDDEHGIYGFPPEPGQRTIKFGVHSPGETTDPDDPARPVDPVMLNRLAQFARKRFSADEPELSGATACLYTRDPNDNFMWGEQSPGVFWASPCSGHGFKFGPWIGQRMADFVERRMAPSDVPRFCR